MAVVGLLSLCLGLQIAIIVVLLDTRAQARPLVSRSAELLELADQAPYLRQASVEALLALAADQLTELAGSRIQYTFHLSQTFPLSTVIAVNERIPVPVSLTVNDTIPVRAEIPFQQKLVVPVNLQIDQVFTVDTSVPFHDQIVAPVDDVIHIDERFNVRLLGQNFSVPIRGDIPVKLNVTIPVEQDFPIHADIPVQFPISETLSVAIDWTVPVDLDIPLRLPVKTTVIVPFSRTIPIRVDVPLALDAPIDIAIGETPLGATLRELAERLRLLIDED
jgi:hypothetical protein